MGIAKKRDRFQTWEICGKHITDYIPANYHPGKHGSMVSILFGGYYIEINSTLGQSKRDWLGKPRPKYPKWRFTAGKNHQTKCVFSPQQNHVLITRG